jgi:Biopolymer transport protein ExbD/TolR
MRVGLILVLAALGGMRAVVRADDFDRLEGEALAAIPRSPAATAHEALTLAEMGDLPRVLAEARSALVVARTDQGNVCRMLVAAGLRRPPGGQGEPVPVLVLERFDTFEAGAALDRLAHGKDVLLFDGFRFDLDLGQVVPVGQGGDVQFLAGGGPGPRLAALATTTLYTVTASPIPAEARAGQPSAGRGVRASDFAGRYRLFADGQWSGMLELTLDGLAVSGRFRSDQTGSVYPVDGTAPADAPGLIRFSITYPRSRQDFEGRLWTAGKGAMAGTLTLLDRSFGFFALREGGHYAPEEGEAGLLTPDVDRPGRRVVVLRDDGRVTLDGKDLDLAGLTEALREAVADDPETWVLLRVPADQTVAAVSRALEAARAAGVADVRLVVAAPADEAEGGPCDGE